MLVDEYHDASWTRGQYPAAPPHIVIPQPFGWLFCWLIVASIKKQPPASSGCFSSGVLRVLFIFGSCIIFLFRSYPYNIALKSLCQRFFEKIFR